MKSVLVAILGVPLLSLLLLSQEAQSAESICPGGSSPDPNVIFCEDFEDSVSAIKSRWNHVREGSGLALVNDVPQGSLGFKSIKMPAGAELYRRINLNQGYDVIYLRYYIKYTATGSENYHHAGASIGGYNPASLRPNPFRSSGKKPSGSDEFSIALEAVETPRRFDFYSYWMGMHPDGAGQYWGNILINGPGLQVPFDRWVCVEIMAKMNNPLNSNNGELKFWLDGQEIIHIGPGFPNGNWYGGRFFPNPNDSGTFEGFQWRISSALQVNFIWLENYVSNGGSSTIWYDHVVVSKAPIGPLGKTPPAPTN